MPVRSPRAVYLITGMTANVDDDPNKIDNLPGGTEPKTTKAVYAKMKISIGDFLGLVPLAATDAAFQGTFKPGGMNAGAKYYRNIGGFREAAYTIEAKTTFAVNERVYSKTTKTTTIVANNFKTLSIGFPKGHSVTEFLAWIQTNAKIAQIRAVITPKGRRVDLGA